MVVLECFPQTATAMLSDTNCHGSYTVVARAATTAVVVVVVAAAVVVVVAVVVALALGLAATGSQKAVLLC